MRKYSLLNGLVTIYLILIVLWLLLRILFFDRFWPLAMLNTLAEYLFLPLPILFIGGLWQVHWNSLAKLTIPAAVFIILFGHLFWPPFPASVKDDERSITIMSFNVLFSNKAYEAIAATIRIAEPDIVGFQELRAESSRAIVERLAEEYPYQTLRTLTPVRGVGLLSKFPVEQAEWFELPPLDIALHAIVRVEGEQIHVFVVHLSPNNFFDHSMTEFVPLVLERYGRRAVETSQLQKRVKALDDPVLLLCDCNLTDTSEAYSRLSEVLGDSFREAGWGFGHTLHPPGSPIPIQRIDYVWHSREFRAIEAYVGQDGGSDHLPIVAKLMLDEAW